jgi:hypothetical protein
MQIITVLTAAAPQFLSLLVTTIIAIFRSLLQKITAQKITAILKIQALQKAAQQQSLQY